MGDSMERGLEMHHHHLFWHRFQGADASNSLAKTEIERLSGGRSPPCRPMGRHSTWDAYAVHSTIPAERWGVDWEDLRRSFGMLFERF